jgi:hypothetical protein
MAYSLDQTWTIEQFMNFRDLTVMPERLPIQRLSILSVCRIE